MLTSLYLVPSKYKKMLEQGIPPLGRTVLRIFSVPLYTDYLSNLRKKHPLASTRDTNVEYQIWN